MNLTSWGRVEHPLQNAVSSKDIASAFLKAPGFVLPRGLGRSYGDVCLNAYGRLILTDKSDAFISFDEHQGVLEVECGVTIYQIQHIFISRGWLLPVTPGTQFVTIGGAIANDVHGKNHHHYGSLGNHIVSLKLLKSDGKLYECSPISNADLFYATIGGIGLTGIILSAKIQLKKIEGPWLQSETIPFQSVDDFFTIDNQSHTHWEYTVAWFDMLTYGRGLYMRANHTDASHLPIPKFKQKSYPFEQSFSLINALTLKPFNTLYYHLNKNKPAHSLVHYLPFSYPLDGLSNWNKIYGKSGFYQYQCVIPKAYAKEGIKALLKIIAAHKEGSFLAVLKSFGSIPSVGLLSFPMEGVTLALDFPNRCEKTFQLFKKLDEVVSETGGRIYLAKDARMDKALFELSYPNCQTFLKYRDSAISSSMSRRLMGF